MNLLNLMPSDFDLTLKQTKLRWKDLLYFNRKTLNSEHHLLVSRRTAAELDFQLLQWEQMLLF